MTIITQDIVEAKIIIFRCSLASLGYQGIQPYIISYEKQQIGEEVKSYEIQNVFL
jgi:hypothetical protein